MTSDATPPDPAMLDSLEAALAHRGPDGRGRLVRGGTGLVHLRLSIVDLVTGDQPLLSDRGTALIANGEIYNDFALRAALPGVPFRTKSDCEPAVFLYDREGPAFADALRGMYAVALHDPAADRLVLARDPFGIKPLYYAQTDALFAFASEPAALLAAGLGARAVDLVRMAELLQLKFTTGVETIFPGIRRVLPGETLVVEHGRVVAARRRASVPSGRRVGATVADVERVLLDSVTAHLRSDVPYGLFLSGGIDSAALLALMRRATGRRVHALTVGWAGAAADETAEAERLARLMGADCDRIEMGSSEFWRLAPRIVACVDDPTADAAVLPSWMLGRAASAAGLKVALSGEGGDELFGGYARYRKRRAPWRWLSRPPRSSGVFGDAVSGWRGGLAAAEAAVGRELSPLQASQAVDLTEWLPNDLLTKLDRTLMAHGVEGRTPFLDPEVAALAFPLPDRQKAGARFGKVLLRRWLAEAFPQAGAWARKRGFKPPVGAWIAERAERIAPLVARQPGIAAAVPAEVVRRAFADAGRDAQPAWSLLFGALWHAHHVIGRPAAGDVEDVLSGAMPSAARAEFVGNWRPGVSR